MSQLATHKVILKNFSLLTVSTALSQVISLLAILRITSILPPENYGAFSFLVSQGTLLYTIADLGLRHVVIRAVARDANRSQSLFISGLFVKSIALLFIIVLYTLYNYVVGNLTPIAVTSIFLFAASNCAANLFENIFFGRQKMRAAAILNAGYSILWLACVILLPAKWFDSQTLFLFFLLLNIIKAAAYLIALYRTKSLTGLRKSVLPTSLQLATEGWPYFAIILIMLPFTALPANFLELRSNVQEVGFFSLAQRLLGPISIVMELALAAIFPNLSSLWLENARAYKGYVSSSFRFYVLLNLSLCFLFSLFAKEIVILLFPHSYLPAVIVSKIHVWYLYLALIDSLIGTILSSANKEKIVLKFAMLRTAVSAPILYFASVHGAKGFSIASVATLSVFLCMLWFVFVHTLAIRIKHSGYFLLASIALPATGYLLDDRSALLKVGVTMIYASMVVLYARHNTKTISHE